MANPLVVNILTEWVWQKVATAVKTGAIHRLSSEVYYYQTFRLTGQAAPTAPTLGTIPEEAVKMFGDSDQVSISSVANIDVYIMVQYDNTLVLRDGKVRVDV